MQSFVNCPSLFHDIERRHQDMLEIGWGCLVLCDGNERSQIGHKTRTVED